MGILGFPLIILRWRKTQPLLLGLLYLNNIYIT
nr:MAG TPA: hypothetical protein [Caudoviricetes sp.]